MLVKVKYIFAFLILCFLTFTSQATSSLRFQQFQVNDGLSQGTIYNINQTKDGYLWVATQDGLNRFDGNSFKQYRWKSDNPSSIANNIVRKIYVDSEDILWIGTQNGLSRYNPEQDNFINYFASDKNTGLLDSVIWEIYEDNKKTLWVSTESGLHKYDRDNDRFTKIKILESEDIFREIRSIFQDKQDNYWLGTFEGGALLLHRNLSYVTKLNQENKFSLVVDAHGIFQITEIENNYWLATDNGIYVISPDYSILHHFNTANSQLHSDVVRSIITDKDKLWISTSNGLNELSLHNYQISPAPIEPGYYSLSDNMIFSAYKDMSGTLWFGTFQGLNRYDPMSSYFSQHLGSQHENVGIIKLIEDPKNGFWALAPSKGLYWFDANHDQEKLYPIDASLRDNLYDMVIDSSGSPWLLDLSGNLFRYNLATKTHALIKNIDNINKYHRGYIYMIGGMIWLSSNDGVINKFVIETQETQNIASPFNGGEKYLDIVGSYKNRYLWITDQQGNISRFDTELNSFQPLSLKETLTDIITIKENDEYVLIGTNQHGLLSYHKRSQKIVRFDEKNNLPNNAVATLELSTGNNVWVGTNQGVSVVNLEEESVKNYNDSYGLTAQEVFVNSSTTLSNSMMMFGTVNGFYIFSPNQILEHQANITEPLVTQVYIANKPLEEFDSKGMSNYRRKNTLSLEYNQSPVTFEFIAPNSSVQKNIAYRYRLNGLDTDWLHTDSNNRRATYTNLPHGEFIFEYQAYNPNLLKYVGGQAIQMTIRTPWWITNVALFIYGLATVLTLLFIWQQYRNKIRYLYHIRQSEERLKLSLWGSGDEMWDWNIRTGKIYRSNIWSVLEFPQDGRRNLGAEQTNIHSNDLARVRETLNDHFESKTDYFETTYRVKDKSDRWLWVLDRGKIVERDEHDKPTRMTGTLKDISHIKKAEERLRLFAKCIENISDAIAIYDRNFIAVDCNKAYSEITGIDKPSVVGKSLQFKQYPANFTQAIRKNLITQGSWRGEIEDTHATGSLFVADVTFDVIRDESGSVSHFVSVFSDITARKKNEAELRILASTDTLTGLPNRSYFQANQKQLVEKKTPHALFVFDLDNFKKINDSIGHQVGDLLLKEVATRLESLSSESIQVYRLGGDEFSVILENTNDIHTITTLAKKILNTVAESYKLSSDLNSHEIVLYSSIGIVLYPEDGSTPEELLKNADTAMYHAKGLGGNKYQFFSESMNKQAVKRLHIENLIRHGLKSDYFSVFYQPKINIKTGKISGMEALVRFETPSKGIISPGVFIPVSEETGQIVDIGEIVLRKSCIATKQWIDAGLFEGRIAVNLSAVQFAQPKLVSIISEILRESELPPENLELEITEGTVMDSPQKAIETMLEIRAMGIHLALDDFGTGYSSLSYLKKFPLNTLKIDKAFVDDIVTSDQGRNMVATIVTIAHNLGLDVVAEGVENEKQLAFLKSLRCEQLQGYLYSKPLSEKDFKRYLVSHQIADKSTPYTI